MKYVDKFLNNITMYRLTLYFLVSLLIVAMVFGLFGLIPYNPFYIILTTLFLLTFSWIINTLFAKVMGAATNVESTYVIALILALIITPAEPLKNLAFLFWVAVWAMASKYIFAINRKHIFNPSAFAVLLTSFTIGQSASWWVGSLPMLPFVIVGGLLLVRKIKRFDLVWGFLMAVAVTTLGFSIAQGTNPISILQKILFYSPLLFFASVMLTEPLTTPPTKKLQVMYGALVGFLFVPQTHIGSLYFTPELSLIFGNIFSYLVSSREKLRLTLKNKLEIANNTYDFIFQSDRKLPFSPGQYLEWTLAHENPDNRGNRRYFTIASSPREDLRIGVKFYNNPSSFKKKLISIQEGDEIFAGQLAGSFIMPKDSNQKLAFFAGGIGITPFRSMIKSLLDGHERRSIVLFYSNNTVRDCLQRCS